jgi:hypothetical protein
MIRRKSLIIFLLLSLGGGVLMVRATSAIRELESALDQTEATGRKEGESFVRTLQGQYAERQLKAFDERRMLAMKITAARRDRFLGLFALAAATLVLVAGAVLHRIAREIEEDRRLLQGDQTRP